MEKKAFNFGDLSISVDTSDVSVLKRYRQESDKFAEIMKVAPKDDYIETLEYTIKAMTDLLDGVLGDGSSKLMFGETITSFDQVSEGFISLKEYFNDQQNERDSRMSKFKPNRAQRRAEKK